MLRRTPTEFSKVGLDDDRLTPPLSYFYQDVLANQEGERRRGWRKGRRQSCNERLGITQHTILWREKCLRRSDRRNDNMFRIAFNPCATLVFISPYKAKKYSRERNQTAGRTWWRTVFFCCFMIEWRPTGPSLAVLTAQRGVRWQGATLLQGSHATCDPWFCTATS